nr:GNAT family N-acetyltransferase [Leucobacter sp. G161]
MAPTATEPTPPTTQRETEVPEISEPILVVHEPDERRYAIYEGEKLAGFTAYRPTARDEGRAFVHTEIDEKFGGRGLAGTLVSEALADTRDAGLRIVPYCPFVVAWLKKHPEFEDAVDWPAA